LKVLEWKKPAIVFYHEKVSKPETEPFAVIKAKRITVETEDKKLKGKIDDFFTLIGDDWKVSIDGSNIGANLPSFCSNRDVAALVATADPSSVISCCS